MIDLTDYYISILKREIQSCKNIGICPYGKQALLFQNILEKMFGKHIDLILDRKLSEYNDSVRTISDLRIEDLNEMTIFITARNSSTAKELSDQLKSIKPSVRLIDIHKPQIIEMPQNASYFHSLKKSLHTMMPSGKFEYIRMGRQHDGGYVMIDDFKIIKGIYSFGISDDISWEKDIMNYTKKKIPLHLYDPTIARLPEYDEHLEFHKEGIAGMNDPLTHMKTMETILKDCGGINQDHLLLKMDVEGAEWDFIATVPDNIMRKFQQISFELHGCINPGNKQKVLNALEKLNRTHQAVWIHGNNWGKGAVADDILIPDALEVTLLSKDIYTFHENGMEFPMELDSENHYGVRDFVLGRW